MISASSSLWRFFNKEDLDLLLSTRYSRTISNSAIRFDKKYYAIYGEDEERVYFSSNTPAMLNITLSGKMTLFVNSIFYGLKEIPARQSSSIYVDSDERDSELDKPSEPPYIPEKNSISDRIAAMELPKLMNRGGL